MGDVKKKAEQEIKNATGNVADFVEGSVSSVRDEARRNLGSDAQTLFDAALNTPEKILSRTGENLEQIKDGQFREGASGLVGDAIRAAYLPLAVGYDVGKAGVGSLMGGNKLPNISESLTDSGYSPEQAAKDLAGDAAMQEQLQSSRRRGRASTVLSGPQGLSGSTQYSARRTLLGV